MLRASRPPGLGILEFTVAIVMSGNPYTVPGDRRSFEFYMEHVPLEECKPHSEVRCRETLSGNEVKPPKIIREAFRIRLSQRISILKGSPV